MYGGVGGIYRSSAVYGYSIDTCDCVVSAERFSIPVECQEKAILFLT